jgi:excisionase family DNA binding protein
MNNLPERRIFSINEIAIFLGRSKWTIAEMIRTGKLPYIKDGKRKLLDILDVEQWIEKNKKIDNYD